MAAIQTNGRNARNDVYDWFLQGDAIYVLDRFDICSRESVITVYKDKLAWGEFPLDDDWYYESTQEEYNMSREDWKFVADQLGVQYPSTLSTKLIAKRCQEFCLKIVEEYLS